MAVRTHLVSDHFPLGSQGDSTRQRHGDGCRVPVSHHLFINLKSFTYNSISEDADVFFSLYDTREAKQIRYAEECWCVVLQDKDRETRTCTHTWSRTVFLRTLTEAFCRWQKLWVDFFYSEKFMVKLNKNGGPKNPEKVDRLCALFTVRKFPVCTYRHTYRQIICIKPPAGVQPPMCLFSLGLEQ